jgi:ribose transport system permease protein
MEPQPSPRRAKLAFVLNTIGPFLILGFVTLLFSGLLAWRDLSETMEFLELEGWSGAREAWDQTEFFGLAAFFSVANLKIVLTQTVIVAIAALGMTMIIISGGIDLSVGSAIALTSVAGAVLIQNEHPLVLVIPATILAGAMIGTVNGSLIARFRMVPFIVTLGMLGVARGLAKWLAGNQTVNFPENPIGRIMTDPDPLGKLPPPGVGIAILLAVMMIVVMRRTLFGRYVFAIGSNEATARLCGIRTRMMKVAIYGVSGLFVGLAGVMQLSRLRQGDPTAAIGLELDIIAAVVIGGASLSGGTGSILGSMIGALTMAVLRTGSQYMDWPTYMQEIIIGVLIIVAVGLDRLRQGRTG